MPTRRRGKWVGAGVAALWLAAVVVLDVVVGPSTAVFVTLFSLAPLIACAVLPVRSTAAFAAAAVVAAVGAGWWDHTWGTGQQLVRVLDTVLVSVAAVVVAAVRVRREQRYARLVVVAEVAQRAILPTLRGVVGQVAAGARYLSAAEDALVGGDLYDWYHSDASSRFLIGDVRGKGIDAVEQAARTIRAFRQSAASESSLPRVAGAMSSYLAPFLDEEEFVTASLVEVSDDQLTVVSCGHPPPMVVTDDGAAALLQAPVGLPLGWGDHYAPLMAPWAAGERLLMYTDGLSEARDQSGQFLSPLGLAEALAAGSVDEALDLVLAAVRRHSAHRHLTDDLALVLVENVASHRSRSGVPPERVRDTAEVAWLPTARHAPSAWAAGDFQYGA